jgi:hypothetical protein
MSTVGQCASSNCAGLDVHNGLLLSALWDTARHGHDWASRYPLIVQAVSKLKVRSCLIDGEAVCCKRARGAEL